MRDPFKLISWPKIGSVVLTIWKTSFVEFLLWQVKSVWSGILVTLLKLLTTSNIKDLKALQSALKFADSDKIRVDFTFFKMSSLDIWTSGRDVSWN